MKLVFVKKYNILNISGLVLPVKIIDSLVSSLLLDSRFIFPLFRGVHLRVASVLNNSNDVIDRTSTKTNYKIYYTEHFIDCCF